MIEHQHFYEKLWEYYDAHGRHDLPWRQPEHDGAFDPYKIMVSEIMLQQTQVSRVVPKYHSFLQKFPKTTDLAAAKLGDVLRQWQGLGYNRRAKFLWQAAQKIISEHGGNFPETVEELVKLPGIGKNTAGAIAAYAYNKPAIFIETNIRTVYIHHFFAGKKGVDDKEIISLLHKTIDTKNPRTFYWALMDYGTYLKQTQGNLSKLSNGYVKQSKFHGSNRQIRGAVIRQLSRSSGTYDSLQNAIQDERLDTVLAELVAEGLITKNGRDYSL
jgi:A/G-specific adenine glycosylase